MPSAWEWWAGGYGHVEYEGVYTGCGLTRRDAIAAALSDCEPDENCIIVVEARSSTAKKYEGTEYVPFTHTRNREQLTIAAARAAASPICERRQHRRARRAA